MEDEMSFPQNSRHIEQLNCMKLEEICYYGEKIQQIITMGKPPALPGRLPEFDISRNKRKSPIM